MELLQRHQRSRAQPTRSLDPSVPLSLPPLSHWCSEEVVVDVLRGADKEYPRTLYNVHLGVVDWRLIIKKIGIIPLGLS